MPYAAFLSYSHADVRWARWLLRRLEAYRVPTRLVGTPGRNGPLPDRLGAVFRDRDELPSAGDLSSTIQAALADSRALVVLCSPAAARSRWVNAEIEAFRALGRGDRVHCFVVGGEPGCAEPGRECFPPALLRADADGRVHEPLAADARTDGDGRERAFLKLLAGLLGVGYDRLAQREAQRRHRRQAALTAAAFAGMAVTSALAYTAWQARNDAQRRQAQAEDILDFMLGDLRTKLGTVGRLDLLRAVDDKATSYFATLDRRDMSDAALATQARTLTGIGQVRMDEGNHTAALRAFHEAHARSELLAARHPDSGPRLFDRAQAEYWLGFVAFQQGRHGDAEPWWRRYRDSAERLAAMDRANFDWQKEVAYAHHNLAVLDEKRGNLAAAEAAMAAELALYRGWLRDRPADTMLRWEAANLASWLGSLAMQQGRLAQAQSRFGEQLAMLQRNRQAEPENVHWSASALDALLLLVGVQSARGHAAAAHASAEQACQLAARLAEHDSSNNDWRASLGFCHLWRAQLMAADGPRAHAATAHARRALSLLRQAHAIESGNARFGAGVARAHLLLARLALGQGMPEAGARHADTALVLLQRAWAAAPTEPVRVLLAQAHVLQGDLARLHDDPGDARASWLRARELLLTGADAALPYPRLEPLVHALEALGETSAAIPLRQRLQASGHAVLAMR